MPLNHPAPPRPISLLALGFRPFFLMAGIGAVLMLLAWLGMLNGLLPYPAYLVGPTWHAHEMLFGYTAAVIAGFLLTAGRNWSNIPTPTGLPLGALALLWLGGRLAPWLGLPPGAAALIDLAFFPALTAALWRPLWNGPNPVNRAFIALLAGMTLANLSVHLDALGLLTGGAQRGQRMMLDLVLLTILLVGGRVMPFFTERGLGNARPVSRRWVEQLTFGLAMAMLAAHLLWPQGQVGAALAILLGGVQLIRIGGWYDGRVWRTPMLAVLYGGFFWLALGLMLDALPAFTALAPNRLIHSLTIGAIGVLTLGMMARVSVGHTGRAMQAERLTVVAFMLINLTAALRALGPLLYPAGYDIWLTLSGICWSLAFLLFLWVHAPMLVSPRPDGLPG